MRFIVIGLAVFMAFTAPVAAEDIDCRTATDECLDYGRGCGCATATAPVISSSTGDDVNVGTRFTVSGGRAPYGFTFTGGSLQKVEDQINTWEISSISACSALGETRSATATVADACGEVSENEVRLPGGTWVHIPSGDGGGCDGSDPYCCYGHYNTIFGYYVYEGAHRWYASGRCFHVTDGTICSSCVNYANTCEQPPFPITKCIPPTNIGRYSWTYQEWKCM